MGQYHMVVNIDKEQTLDPHKFGSGLKLMEFGNDGQSILTGLAVLLADSNGRGGGDLRCNKPIVGSWAGDRIVITGDYGDEGKWVEGEERNLYHHAQENYADISNEVIEAIVEGEGNWHRLSKINLSETGWRNAPV